MFHEHCSHSERIRVLKPGQEGNMSVYRRQLAGITAKLQGYSQRTGAKLLFGLTSPMMADLSADNDVVELNRRASEVMSDAQVGRTMSFQMIGSGSSTAFSNGFHGLACRTCT